MRPIKDCFKIIKLLESLNDELTHLRALATVGSWESFELAIVNFSKKLNRAKRLIKGFIATYEASPILKFNFDDGTIILGFERLSAKGHIATLKPVSLPLNPVLLRELLEGMPKPNEISRMIDKRIRLIMEREKQRTRIKKEEPELLRSGEAARMIGISRQSLWRYFKEGRIPERAVQRLPSGHLRYYKHEIEKFKSKRKDNSGKSREKQT